MPNDRLKKLSEAMGVYGETSIAHMRVLHAAAEAIITALSAYLGPDAEVCGVPPIGQWMPREDYRDQKFSDFDRRLLSIELIKFGISIRIPNTRDAGCLWLRQVVELDVEAGDITVGIGYRALMRIPKVFELHHLTPLIEAIFDETMRFFSEPAERHKLIAGGKMGFTG